MIYMRKADAVLGQERERKPQSYESYDIVGDDAFEAARGGGQRHEWSNERGWGPFCTRGKGAARPRCVLFGHAMQCLEHAHT